MPFVEKITKEEKEQLFQWALEGVGYAEISNRLQNKISKQRVYQLCQKQQINSKEIQKAKKKKSHEERMFSLYGSKWNEDGWKKSEKLSAAKEKFRVKKKTATYTGWDFDIDFCDVDFPDVCPVLGIPLDYFAEQKSDNSISFDRVNSSKGYVKGNVVVMSWRANRIKNDGTADEHIKIAEFMKQHK